MTQQPFSRPGAVDLSGLQQSASTPPSSGAPAGSAYAVSVTEENFQSLLEASVNAPVLVVFFSAATSPQSAQFADDVAAVSAEFEGRFLAGLVDVDANPAIAQAAQIRTVPFGLLFVGGRPMPLFQSTLPVEDLREALTQVLQQLTAQGITGRHQPRQVQPAEADGEAAVDPRYAPAQDALEAGDIDRAVAEYQKLVDANPADAEAAAGLAMAKVLQRTTGADLNAARSAAAERPDDVDAQTLVADLDLLGGHVDDAFNRLIDLVRRSAGDDRDRARQHLLDLFAAVGNEDPRVLRGRQNLASALF